MQMAIRSPARLTALLLLANRWSFEHGAVIELQSERHVPILVRIQLLESTSSQCAQTIDAVDQGP